MSISNGIFIYSLKAYLFSADWENGQCFTLTDANQNADVKSLFVTAAHVYAAGFIHDRAVYWKDGVVTFLSGISSKANSI